MILQITKCPLNKGSWRLPFFFQGFFGHHKWPSKGSFWDDSDITWTEALNWKLWFSIYMLPWAGYHNHMYNKIEHTYICIYAYAQGLPDSASFVTLLNILEYLHLPHQTLFDPGEGEEIKHHNCATEFKCIGLRCLLIIWWCRLRRTFRERNWKIWIKLYCKLLVCQYSKTILQYSFFWGEGGDFKQKHLYLASKHVFKW